MCSAGLDKGKTLTGVSRKQNIGSEIEELWEKIMSNLTGWLVGAVAAAVLIFAIATGPARHQQEYGEVVARLMAMTEISAAPEYQADVLIPPGQVYDPLSAVAYGDGFLLNDDGGVEGEKGSRILKVGLDGGIDVVVGLDKLPPVVGFDRAPDDFGAFGGQLFVMSQKKSGFMGALDNHLIQRISTDGGAPTVVCELPRLSPRANVESGVGLEGRFGPKGTPFGDRFFSISLKNNTIYQTTGDGKCAPFVTFDGATQGQPFYTAFTDEGRTMLVSLGEPLSLDPGVATTNNPGRIARVSPDGAIDAEFYATDVGRASGMDFAPAGFGDFGGHLFVAVAGEMEIPVPMTQQLKRDGKVIRIAPDGSQHPVATGFVNPMGLRFIHGRLIVSDINGDFIAGGREVPDGFVVEITTE